MSGEGLVERLRDDGWMVAVHNDYRLAGTRHTFWLFTHSNGRWIKGEGESDAHALAQCIEAADALTTAEARIHELEAEVVERDHVLDTARNARERAVAMWRSANPGNDLSIPDSAVLSVWLMARIQELEAALRPFVKMSEGELDTLVISTGHRDFRRARRTLRGE